MATVIELPKNEPVSLHEAYYALSVVRDNIKTALREAAESVRIVLEPSGALKIEIVVGGLPTNAVEMQQRVLFMIENNMAGCPLMNPVTGFENGRAGKRVVTALVVRD